MQYHLLLLQSSSPYAGRGSTNKVVEWYNFLVLKTKAFIHHWPSSEKVCKCYLSVMPHQEVVRYYSHLSYC